MKLLLSQKNDIFDIILEEGFNPNDFIFTEEILIMNEIVTYLRYKNTKYYFMFRSYSISGYQTVYSPAERSLEIEETVRGGWKQFLSRIKRWLRNLKRETNSIDKWDTLKRELQLVPFSFSNGQDNEKFTIDELKLIELKIGTIKDEISKLELPQDKIRQIIDKLDKLNEKANKLSKTDWKELFIGAVLGIILNLAIPQNTAQLIWEIIRQTFKQYILP